MDLINFSYLSEEEINTHTAARAGETKIGQKISFGVLDQVSSKQFVILGIEESIGVKGNLGVAGTHTAWKGFLSKFLNVQHTHKLNAEQIHLLGTFNFNSLSESCKTIAEYRTATEKVDDQVYPLIQDLVEKGHVPIIIGGSHANAFPILKGCSLAFNEPVSAINLDAHADFRALEGRHSGNPFSYAYDQQYLNQYRTIGLHENYNSQSMLDHMDEAKVEFTSWEDIYLRKAVGFNEILNQYIKQTSQNHCGIELDLDSIENTLSSAMGPSGFTVTEARQYAYHCGQHPNATYLHLCEASIQLENGRQSATIGKLLSYLVTDFIKGALEK